MIRISFKTENPEVLIAVLSDFPFEGFQEFADRVEAYAEEMHWTSLEKVIRDRVKDIAMIEWTESMPEKNWNKEWESSFQPVLIDDFCAIRASFHTPIDTCLHEIVIDPRMAFGTGHHETTALMIRMMRSVDFKGKSVLDLGCGTGILAILAAKIGAETVTAVDNDAEAVQNAIENAAVNHVQIQCQYGTVDHLQSASFDVILANINRNVLLEIMPDLKRVLRPNGLLFLSGFLPEDETAIVDAADRVGLLKVSREQSGEWSSLWMMNDG
jgi:ribosomal protein L11 methyltransferase